MKDWADEITNNPLAVHLGATTVNVTKIQEIDDPEGNTFKVILVSGVTAWGKLSQYDEAMTKYLDYLALTYKKLLIAMAQAEELDDSPTISLDGGIPLP